MGNNRENDKRAVLKRHLRELREGLASDDPRAKMLNSEFKRKKCSQTQIAEYLGLKNYSRYQRYEDPLTKAVPTALELKRLCELYGCSMDYFFEAYNDDSFEHDERRSEFVNHLFSYRKADLLLDAYFRYLDSWHMVANSNKVANHYELLHDFEVSLRQPSHRPVFASKLAKALGIRKLTIFDEKNNERITESSLDKALRATYELILTDDEGQRLKPEIEEQERIEYRRFINYEKKLFREHGLRSGEYEVLDLFMEFVREG